MNDDIYEFHDKRFRSLTLPNTQLERLYDKCRWAEGPVWFNDGGYLLWSDIPNQRILRWTRSRGFRCFVRPPISPMATPATCRGGW